MNSFPFSMGEPLHKTNSFIDTTGATQDYVEDCPVCCHPNLIHVAIDEEGEVDVWGEAEPS